MRNSDIRLVDLVIMDLNEIITYIGNIVFRLQQTLLLLQPFCYKSLKLNRIFQDGWRLSSMWKLIGFQEKQGIKDWVLQEFEAVRNIAG